MSTAYHQLLDATIQHLQDLEKQGVRYVKVSSDTLTALAAPLSVAAVPGMAAARAVAVSLPSPGEAASRVAGPVSTAVTATTQPAQGGEANKILLLAELRQRVLNCVRCPHLVKTRHTVVFGVGNPASELMFIGEAPGLDEDAQGEPFVGRAGQLLTRIIQAMNLSRESVYIANILKCRPDTPGQMSGNRKPTSEEMETCIPHLLEQIAIIQPKVLVALGATAVEGLLGRCPSITRLRGQWQTFRGIPMMPTFHPSFLLRPENVDKKRLVWEDMLAVMEKLVMPITPKQRGFFFKTT